MDNRPIGILDSGVGGLSIWREIILQLPHESTIYVGDSKNCPYGNRSIEEIYRLTKPLLEVLVQKKCKLIVIACNTITVHCLNRLRQDFPNIPIVGTVPVVKKAAEETKNKKVGVLSTQATTKSLYQKKLIEQFANDCEVTIVGTDKLVPLVEKGEINGTRLTKILEQELQPFIKEGVDVVALGCSHFPFLKDIIQDILGKNVLLLDSAGAIARQVNRVLTNNNQQKAEGKPSYKFYTTGDVGNFSLVAEKLLRKKIEVYHT